MQLDPNFAIAWARLSSVNALIYFNRIDTAAAARGDAAKRLENAQKLEPNSAETLLALGYYHCRVLGDYGVAKTTFSRVSKMLPGNSEYIIPQLGRPDAKDIGIKALPTSRKPSPLTHLMRSY